MYDKKVNFINEENKNSTVIIMDEVISVRISRKLKHDMKNIPIDWSQEIRDMLQQRVTIEKRKRAAEKMDELLEDVKPGFDSGKALREDRDR